MPMVLQVCFLKFGFSHWLQDKKWWQLSGQFTEELPQVRSPWNLADWYTSPVQQRFFSGKCRWLNSKPVTYPL